MGQEQSASAPPPASRGRRGGQRGRGRDTRRAKDEFLTYTDVTDNITSIHDRKKKHTVSGGDEEAATDIDLNKLLASVGRQRKTADDDDTGDLYGFPGGGDGEESSDDDDDEDAGEARGTYHHEVQRQESDEVTITNPKCHPIASQGESAIFAQLAFRDLSEWKVTFPVHKVEWFMSTEIGSQSNFLPFAFCTGKSCTLPSSAVGKYVCCQASRRVEDQLAATNIREMSGGVFDAHVSEVTHTAVEGERRFVDVVSTTIIGPILVSDEWAFSITEALGYGKREVAVKLRDEPLDPHQERCLDDSGAKNAIKKLPSLFKVTIDTIEFQYEQPDKLSLDAASGRSVTSTLMQSDWMQKVKRLFVTDDGTHGDRKPRSAGKGVSPAAQDGSTPSAGEAARFAVPLNLVQVRPSVLKNTLILATELKKVGFSHTRKTQDLIRFDVDPKFGRDLLLFTVIAFQAMLSTGKVRSNMWKRVSDMGDFDLVKHQLQRHLEEIMSKTSEEETAFEEMPATPWDY